MRSIKYLRVEFVQLIECMGLLFISIMDELLSDKKKNIYCIVNVDMNWEN